MSSDSATPRPGDIWMVRVSRGYWVTVLEVTWARVEYQTLSQQHAPQTMGLDHFTSTMLLVLRPGVRVYRARR